MNEKSQENVANLNGLTMEKFEFSTLPDDNLKSRSHHSVITPISLKNSHEEIIVKAERSKSLDPTQHVDFERIKRRQPSLISLGDCNGLAISPDNKNGKWYCVLKRLKITIIEIDHI